MYILIKDPHVRIVGKVEQVQRAKERILSSLDSRVGPTFLLWSDPI